MKSRKKLWGLIIVIVMAISSGFLYKYEIAPKLYEEYLNTGIEYLMNGEYEEAILTFNKAIKIEPKSTEARLYKAKAYIGNKEVNKSVEVLEEAQKIDKTNEKLIKEIINILDDVDSEAAYDFFNRFIEEIGQEKISPEIKEILNLANEKPSEIVADPAPGKYIKGLTIKLRQDKMKLGNSYYYTLDGTDPNKDSKKYNGKIDIYENTIIKVIGYNKKGESSKIVTLEYIVEENMLENIKNNINEGKKIVDKTEVGNQIGNISKKNKDKLVYVIDEANSLLNKEYINYTDAKVIVNKLENAIVEFKNNIIRPTDKSKLKSVINDAQKLYNNAIEGSRDGEYKLGSKANLVKIINECKKINDNKLSNQEEVDNAVKKLNGAIETFKKSKISTFTKEKALQYVINKLGEPFETPDEFNDYIFLSGQLESNGKKYYKMRRGVTDNGPGTIPNEYNITVYEDGTVIEEYISYLQN